MSDRSAASDASADSDAAAEVATLAGTLLLQLRAQGGPADGLKAAGDRGAHELIMDELTRRFPDDAILSEEGADSSARLGRPRVWIVDPLDGTREFSEPPRVDWAVHVALVVDGVLTVGAVALPSQGVTLSTPGFSTPALPVRAPYDGPVRLVVSRTRPTEHARVLAEELQGELVPMGSAGAKAMAVVQGAADVYAHSGGQYEWDSAAPVAVAQAAGLHVSRLDGSPLIYNRADPWMPDVLICRPDLAARVIEICAGVA
ncbi:MAG: cysQ [Ilumatobacteraceae bacterium]|nr:cysQ [Ilumatobacteraceae bacterium]